MRRFILFLLIVSLLVLFPGCAGNKKVQPQNELFTDAFFEDVVSIGSAFTERLTGAQMEPAVAYLKGLHLTPTDAVVTPTNEKGEFIFGTPSLAIVKRDGTELMFFYNDHTLTCVSDPAYGSWATAENEGLYEGLKEVIFPPEEESTT